MSFKTNVKFSGRCIDDSSGDDDQSEHHPRVSDIAVMGSRRKKIKRGSMAFIPMVALDVVLHCAYLFFSISEK